MGVGGLAIVALSFLPLVVHELTTDFSEVQAALAYLRAGGDPTSVAPIPRFLIVASRVVSWPLVGLITTGLGAVVVAVIGVVGLAGWRSVAAVGPERVAVRWLALGLAWTALALTVISPSLATVVEGLPNDHYHAFADPMVFVLLGVGIAALWRAGRRARRRRARRGGCGGSAAAGTAAVTPERLLAVIGVVALIAWAVPHQPPAVASDGGFPAAESAAGQDRGGHPAGSDRDRVAAGLQDRRDVRVPAPPRRPRGGPREPGRAAARWRRAAGRRLRFALRNRHRRTVRRAGRSRGRWRAIGELVDRFRAAPRQTISVYGAAPVLAVR